MSPPLERLRLLASLSLQDLWHDRKVSLCIMASLVAVIAPLLLLFGLKHGVVSQLQSELLSDPHNLEVRMVSSGHFDAQWIDTLRQQPGVGFAIGQTRSLNTQADLLKDSRHFVENAEVIPTGDGDPLLAPLSGRLEGRDVILSASAARRLDVQVGDSIGLRVSRRLAGTPERGRQELQVIGILEASRFARPAIFVALPLLIQLEQFRDGYQVVDFGVETGEALGQRPPTYARARVYAADVDAVDELAQWLNGQHVETSSRLAEIENVKAINHVLGLIFGVIAITAMVGCIASLVGAFLANIDRKRKNFAVLRLLGFTQPSVALYVIMQAFMLTVMAYAAGLVLYTIGCHFFNRALVSNPTTGAFVCDITFVHGLMALVLSLLVASLVAAIGVARAFSIQPAESLREL